MQGRVDISFNVKGTEARGRCRFRARRYGGRGGEFRTEEWSLAMDGEGEGEGRTVQLLEGNQKGDPLGGQLF